MLLIHETYLSLAGEGTRIGVPTVFIRTQGCSLRCGWCDTKYAQSKTKGTRQSAVELLIATKSYGTGVVDVCITGGEPLEQPHLEILELVCNLVDAGYFVVIETSGHIPLGALVERFGTMGKSDRIQFCVDYKLSSSGMNSRMIWEAFLPLQPQDTIKYVVGSVDDFTEAIDHLRSIRRRGVSVTALFSPVFGKIDTTWLAGATMKLDGALSPVRFSFQLHKHLWGNKRGV